MASRGPCPDAEAQGDEAPLLLGRFRRRRVLLGAAPRGEGGEEAGLTKDGRFFSVKGRL